MVIEAMKEIPSIIDLQRYLSHSDPILKDQLDVCQTNDDILHLVSSKCSLSNIGPIESIVDQFKVQAVKPIINEYRASVAKLFDDIPLRYYLGFAKVTLVIAADIDSYSFNDIECLLNAYVSHFDSDINLFIRRD